MKLERLKKVLSEYKWAIALLMLTLAVNTMEITSEYDKDELIRFHVMADNDTVQAQADKLAVKDAVVSFMQQELADSESVEIGQAEGKNWWCVMFPPMCFTGASEDLGAYTDCAPKKEIVVKFKVVEWYKEHFGEGDC